MKPQAHSPDYNLSHLGIIMDGNGRWARNRGLGRSKGHLEGLKTAKTITKAVVELGIPYLSLYVFSTENWKRTQEEVGFLMGLLKAHLKKEWDFYRENQIRVVHSGDLDAMPRDIAQEIQEVCQDTRNHGGLTVNLAINYGGQDEIIRAFQKWQNTADPEPLNVESFSQFLDQPCLPPLDLIIRTAGEQRLSNFLLWQSAYAEYHFSEKLWPDFGVEDLRRALKDYSRRTRKFGGHCQDEQ